MQDLCVRKYRELLSGRHRVVHCYGGSEVEMESWSSGPGQELLARRSQTEGPS